MLFVSITSELTEQFWLFFITRELFKYHYLSISLINTLYCLVGVRAVPEKSHLTI